MEQTVSSPSGGYLGIILNVVIIALVLIPVIVGAKKGFIKTAFSFGKMAGSLAIALGFCRQVSLYLRGWIAEYLIGDRIHQFFETGTSYVTAESLTQAVPSGMQSILSLFGVNVNSLADQAIAEGKDMAAEFADYLTTASVNILAVVIAFAALFIVAWFALMLLGKLLDAIVSKIPVLKQSNTLLGALMGLLIGLFAAWAGAQLIVAVMGLIFHIDYTAYHLLAFFYEVNPLALIFKSIMTAMSGIAVE